MNYCLKERFWCFVVEIYQSRWQRLSNCLSFGLYRLNQRIFERNCSWKSCLQNNCLQNNCLQKNRRTCAVSSRGLSLFWLVPGNSWVQICLGLFHWKRRIFRTQNSGLKQILNEMITHVKNRLKYSLPRMSFVLFKIPQLLTYNVPNTFFHFRQSNS